MKEYINGLCDRIEKIDESVQAFLPEVGRRERLLNEAAELERRYLDVEKKPSLYGTLVGIKDIFRVNGFQTKAGSQLPAELFEGTEALCVSKLRQAGALVVGKTVTTEFAYFEPGPTRNPHNLKHTPGGSSSGSAAAVAAGLCSVALGTQTIGSVIRPAAFCGIVGFKPSYERISREGVLEFSRTVDHVGIFSPNISEIRKTAAVICNTWNNKETKLQLGDGKEELPVLAVPEGPYLEQMPPDTLVYFEQQLAHLANEGYVIKRVQAMPNIAKINLRHRRLIAAEMANAHQDWFARYGSLYRQRTTDLIIFGQGISEMELAELRKTCIELRHTLQEIMEQNEIDLWVSPSALGEAPVGIKATGDPIMNLPWTQAGLPCLNIPAGKGKIGMPLGLQFCAGFMQDEQLLDWAVKLETVIKKY
ncbi:MAG: amidase [Firmicutes bacterium HGW-Firmicutes-12]|jgi:Asp-tRNA(Asn)/Glu-tRNA(Gln) amidotransferase A subunit family amidase|nr:MAG: amidase [Firmicutes bacterium HGW-Firmicutes-12]